MENYLKMKMQQEGGKNPEALKPMLNTILAELTKQRDALEKKIGQSRYVIREQDVDIKERGGEIRQLDEILKEQRGNLEENSDMLNVRDRMLELSEEKNVYKQKVIYTLVSLIIGVFMLMIVGYAYFNR